VQYLNWQNCGRLLS